MESVADEDLAPMSRQLRAAFFSRRLVLPPILCRGGVVLKFRQLEPDAQLPAKRNNAGVPITPKIKALGAFGLLTALVGLGLLWLALTEVRGGSSNDGGAEEVNSADSQSASRGLGPNHMLTGLPLLWPASTAHRQSPGLPDDHVTTLAISSAVALVLTSLALVLRRWGAGFFTRWPRSKIAISTGSNTARRPPNSESPVRPTERLVRQEPRRSKSTAQGTGVLSAERTRTRAYPRETQSRAAIR